MARREIFEVLMRSADGSTSLGFFTDDFLATQAIDHLYGLLRQSVLRNDPTVAVITSAVNPVGWDQWYNTNKGSADAVFYMKPASLYNAVPTGITNFTFVEDGDTGVNPF